MATRTERVVLELQSNISTQLAKDAAAVAILKRELSSLDGTTRSTSSSTRTLEQDSERLGTRMESNGRTIDKLSGRLELFAHAAAALGPALVPIGAAAIPLLSSIGAGLGSAAAGAGVAGLAFHGLGDALTKFNKASLMPTAANITNAQMAMDKLPPTAQLLVLQLHALNPELDKLRRAAASGFAPGVSDGLNALISDAPIVRKAVQGIGDELGNLARSAGQSLASDAWRPFIRFVGQEAPRELDMLGRSAGSVTHGLAELWMAFTPLNQGVDSGLLRMTREFDAWATSLGKTKGFESFVQYIQENGPRVTQLLGELGHTFVDIIQAAAPLGGPTLDALNLVVHALDLLAQSPLATPLLALLQINSVLKLTTTGLRGLGVDATIGLGGVTRNANTSKGALSGLVAEAKAAGLALRTIGGNLGKNSATGRPLLTGVSSAQMASLAKGAGFVAGTAVLASGAADKLGAANAATYTLAGSIAGPLGAAVGASIGSFADWRSTVAASESSIKSLQSASDSFDLSALQAQIDAVTANAHKSSLGTFLDTSFHGFTGGLNTQDSQIQAANTAFGALQNNATALQSLFTGFNNGAVDKFGQSWATTNTQLAQTANRAQPAMAALGITVSDLQNAAKANDGTLEKMTGRIVQWTNHADSASGRTHAVADAFAAMSDDTLTLDQRVQSLSDALDALTAPGQNAATSLDAWRSSLRNFAGSLDKTSHSLTANTDAGDKNRAAVRTSAADLIHLIEAQAANGASASKLASTLRDGTKALLDQGVQAGLSRKELLNYIDKFHLLPRNVSTLLELLGVDVALRQARRLAAQLRALHDKTITLTTVNATGGRVLPGQADGGTVRGPSGPYGDRVLTMLAPGEEVISNRHGQADQHRALLKAINARRYADGGTVARSRANVYSSTTNYAGTSIDYSRLAGAMSQARPLYGDVNISGDPTTFKRQMRQDHAMAQMSGVRRG